jgi:HSP20 family protein
MTFYIQSHPFGFAQDRQFRRASRHRVEQPQQRALGVNVQEQDDAYILSALVPGLKAENLNIQVLDNVVSIEGEFQAADAEYLLNELPSGSFRRALRLPTEIEAEKSRQRSLMECLP